jgi:catechol 1,2-dioxygenase
MTIKGADDVTAAARRVMEQTLDPRLRVIMVSLIEHLHGFVRDVALTEAEFRAATAILNEIGQQASDTHNEMVLMAGSLGVSSLVCLLNNGQGGATETSQNLLGPFWRLHSPVTENGASIVRSETPGPVLFCGLTFIDTSGVPVADAEVDIWHSSPTGYYENQDESQASMNLRGKFKTDKDGRIWFRSVKPAGYPVPTNGVVGRLLAAQDRHSFRPAHMHALAIKPGYKTLIAQIYDAADPHIDTDVQFGATAHLTVDYAEHIEPHPVDADVSAPWYSLDYRLVMEPGEAVLPKPPIK